ncbi:short-chain dehydrogenase/reductase SDR [Catenulispora acidiphila DSM 44928]|uniref:Short-chain dehydrogenase/reductase SDR n=1 Tax=Catenulispora acidiphila (strain DSM 44928 / JCM 14897 / NBRC 102108 / NRRL B-24433 / ID139908) TaxID=479433 RepID=C7PXS7_CATAD|nr:short-chain dehydrogenase/reductase SDR [Catenulispora acidiphila DSM 44928]
MPDQTGRVAVVTGATSGIGLETARVLAERGAKVVLACRSAEKGRAAAAGIAAGLPTSVAAEPEVVELDLGSLASVRRAAEELREQHPQIDLLINNAGVMDVPFGTTEDGFELHLGINHFGHFALTGLLLPRLMAAPDARIVTVSSLVHTRGRIDFDDLGYHRAYKPDAAYCRSKLANLLFTFELQRRLAAAGLPAVALAAHPGFSRTELFRHESFVLKAAMLAVGPFMMQSAAMGALPTLRAAADPHALGGTYYGPGGRKEQTGHPIVVEASRAAHDDEAQRRLWAESEKLTDVVFPF